MDTSNTEQFYRAGMYEQLKNMRSSMHGRSKRAGAKRRTGVTHHGLRGMHGEGKYPDVFHNKGAGRGSGASRGGHA